MEPISYNQEVRDKYTGKLLLISDVNVKTGKSKIKYCSRCEKYEFKFMLRPTEKEDQLMCPNCGEKYDRV